MDRIWSLCFFISVVSADINTLLAHMSVQHLCEAKHLFYNVKSHMATFQKLASSQQRRIAIHVVIHIMVTLCTAAPCSKWGHAYSIWFSFYSVFALIRGRQRRSFRQGPVVVVVEGKNSIWWHGHIVCDTGNYVSNSAVGAVREIIQFCALRTWPFWLHLVVK